MTRPEINRLSRQFRIHKQNKGGKRPGFVFTNPMAEASDQRAHRFGIGAMAMMAFAPPNLFSTSAGLLQLVYKNQETGLGTGSME